MIAGKKGPVQTEPPSIPVSKFYPDGIFPEGKWQSYTEECAPHLPHSGMIHTLYLYQIDSQIISSTLHEFADG